MQNKPLSLGDILEKIFIVSGKSLSRNIIVSAIIMLPGAIILAFGMNYFFTRLLEFSMNANPHYNISYDPYEIVKFIIAYLAAIFGASMLNLAGYIGTTQVFQKQFNGIKATVSEAFATMFSSKLVELILFTLFVGVAVLAIFSIPIVLLALGASMDFILLSLFGGFLLLAVIGAIIYLSVKWILLIPAMVVENLNLFEALKKSALLVKHHWWRTFGIYLLMSFIVQVALSIITTPISLLIFLDFILSIISSASSMNQNFNDPYFFLNYFSGIGYKIGLISWIAYVIQLCILPCIHVVMYFDLKARNNESNLEFENDELEFHDE